MAEVKKEFTTNTNTNTDDSNINVNTDTSVTSVDIYQIVSVIEAIKAKYIGIPEDTLTMGIFGYLSEIFSNAVENATLMASEYANEAVPTRAKFERNVIAHALSLGINSIQATPAYMGALLCIPEENLIANMKDNTFILDRFYTYEIGSEDNTTYPYHIDYDITIKRKLLPSGEWVYTGMYDIDGTNKISNNQNPYLPAIGVATITGTRLVMIPASLRQTKCDIIHKKIIVNNPLENKVITFSFENQLAYFEVIVEENGEEHYLNPVYDGLIDTTGAEYCNYMYLDSNTLRIVFNRDSYQPRANCEVVIRIWTTNGTKCNFSYSKDKIFNLSSERETYNDIWLMLRPTSDSLDGKDRADVPSLRRNIPKQMLLRGSVTTTTDLNNYFNFMNNDDHRLYFLEKVHNQIERLYYSYALMKIDNNVIPTNSLDVTIHRNVFDNINPVNFVLKPGHMFYLPGPNQKCETISSATSAEIDQMDKNGFLYMNPFLVLLNKNPYFTQYFLTILNYKKILNFEYINDKCEVQFIATTCDMHREFFTEPDTYKLHLEIEQNIATDFDLCELDKDGNVESCKVKVFGVAFLKDDQSDDDTALVPYRYVEGTCIAFDEKKFTYDFEFKFTTDDIINVNSKMQIDGMMETGTRNFIDSFFNSNFAFKFFVAVQMDTLYPHDPDVKFEDDVIPMEILDGYSLSNIYNVYTGIDIFYDYTDIMTSYANLKQKVDLSFDYIVMKMPLVRYKYLNSEERFNEFFKIVETNRIYIQSSLIFLEDSFGINYKFFNTYGPSRLYNIDSESLLNRTNLSLTFEVKFVMANDAYITEDISNDIKLYLEDINELNDLHMPNLITYITNKYRKQLVYFKFLDMNGYGPVKQSIYREQIDEFVEANTVPEFLNINTRLDTMDPDITYIIKE